MSAVTILARDRSVVIVMIPDQPLLGEARQLARHKENLWIDLAREASPQEEDPETARQSPSAPNPHEMTSCNSTANVLAIHGSRQPYSV